MRASVTALTLLVALAGCSSERTTTVLFNQQEKPVKVTYRFYWYDDKGLEILPFERTRTVTVPAHGEANISSQTGNLTASKVRLFLYL